MDFNPYAPGFDANPHPALQALREAHPVYYWEAGRAWLVTRCDDCMAILRDPRFSASLADWRWAHTIPTTPVDEFYADSILTLEPRAHMRIRKLIGPAFAPRALERQRPVIEAIAAELLDAVAGRESFDIATDLAALIPVRVISHIFGVPREHEAAFCAFARTIMTGTLPVHRQHMDEAAIQTMRVGTAIVLAVIEERRRALAGDLLSDLIRAEEEGDRLSSSELVMIARSLLVAGTETTTHLLNFAVLNLLRHPDQLALARSAPEHMEAALDEVLRFDSIAKLGIMRFTREPVEIAGVKIPAGEMVMPLPAAAMRDPRRFPDPDRFDVMRDQRYNLTFGNGPHYCAGASLARLEGRVALSALFDRHPDLQLAGEPAYGPHPALRNIISLPVQTR